MYIILITFENTAHKMFEMVITEVKSSHNFDLNPPANIPKNI